MELLLGLLIAALLILIPLIACVAKGKYWVALVCGAGVFLLVSVLGLIPIAVALCCAVRLAKPSSFWAKRFYGEAKLARACERFAPYVVPHESRDRELAAAWEGVEIHPDELDRMTRKALKREGLI